jgi:hypothetical protein
MRTAIFVAQLGVQHRIERVRTNRPAARARSQAYDVGCNLKDSQKEAAVPLCVDATIGVSHCTHTAPPCETRHIYVQCVS